MACEGLCFSGVRCVLFWDDPGSAWEAQDDHGHVDECSRDHAHQRWISAELHSLGAGMGGMACDLKCLDAVMKYSQPAGLRQEIMRDSATNMEMQLREAWGHDTSCSYLCSPRSRLVVANVSRSLSSRWARCRTCDVDDVGMDGAFQDLIDAWFLQEALVGDNDDEGAQKGMNLKAGRSCDWEKLSLEDLVL